MTRPLKVAMVAGEPSGDNLAAPLIKALKEMRADAQFVGIGGPGMMAAGLDSWTDMNRLSVNGIVDPLLRLPELLSILRRTGDRIIAEAPQVFVGVDFNFFNLLLEERLRKSGIRTVHYVSPTIWAWRKGRIKKIARSVDLMMTLYPFETPVYEEHGVRACFVGHPKADEIDPKWGLQDKADARERLGLAKDARVLAVLPGSRRSEVKLTLPDFMETCRICLEKDPSLKLIIPSANASRHAQIKTILEADYGELPVHLIEGEAQQAMLSADVVLVNSGTATLEAMLLKRPMVMSYRMGKLSYAIVSRLVKTDRFALPNILSGEDLVPEFIQEASVPEKMANKVMEALSQKHNEALIRRFDEIHHLLRKDAARSAAQAVLAEADRES